MPKHPEAHLWPSEVVTLGLLHALKGVGYRAFYRWLTRDYRVLFLRLPERTRLFRLFRTHQDWTQVFLVAPTVLGVIDTYGIELIHPMREGRWCPSTAVMDKAHFQFIVPPRAYPHPLGTRPNSSAVREMLSRIDSDALHNMRPNV
jgi:hypothetical protein